MVARSPDAFRDAVSAHRLDHVRLDPHSAEGSMARHLAQRRAGLLSMMLQYSSGHCWASGELHVVSAPMPDAPIVLRLGSASPAIVPGL